MSTWEMIADLTAYAITMALAAAVITMVIIAVKEKINGKRKSHG